MEEVYVIKLKGLPISDSSEVSKKPSIYANDLSVEVLYGFGLFHLVIGLVAILFGLITVASDEWKVTATGIACGTIFVSTGFLGIWSSIQRKDHFLSSNIAVRVFLVTSTLSLITAFVSIILMLVGALDVDADQIISSKTSPAERRTIVDYDGEVINHDARNGETIDIVEVHPHVKTNLLISLLVEVTLSLFTIFTTCRILWPDSLKSLGGVNWPTRPEVRKKIIVKTSIMASSKGLYQAADFCRTLGPNCVVSLSPPKSYDPQQSNCQESCRNQESSPQGSCDQRVEALTNQESGEQSGGDGVSLASYDDTEFGHEEHEIEFVSRTNSSTSHLLPNILNCNYDSFKDPIRESRSSAAIKDDGTKVNGVNRDHGGNQGDNWDNHHNQSLKLKPKGVNSKKKRIPPPKQPPPPPPPPPPPSLDGSKQECNLIVPSQQHAIKESPGHCVQKKEDCDKDYGHNGSDQDGVSARIESEQTGKEKLIQFMNPVAAELSSHLNRLKLNMLARTMNPDGNNRVQDGIRDNNSSSNTNGDGNNRVQDGTAMNKSGQKEDSDLPHLEPHHQRSHQLNYV